MTALSLRSALSKILDPYDPCASQRTNLEKLEIDLDIAVHGDTYEDAHGHPKKIKPNPAKAKELQGQIAQAQAALDQCAKANPKKLLPFPRVPSQFASAPGNSLKSMEEFMMLSPRPKEWVLASHGHHDDHWTEECQGVTWDGSHFYFSANDEGKPGSHPRAIYRLLGNGDVDTVLELDGNFGNHLGALDFFGGNLFCAMEDPVGILVVDAASGSVRDYRSLPPVQKPTGDISPQGSCSWCAVNPWNELVYSSESGWDKPIGALYAYDPNLQFQHHPDANIHLSQPAILVQGGCFSVHGHVFLATDELDVGDGMFKLIRAYSAFNGFYYGACRVPVGGSDELEDVCYAPMTLGGASVQIHALVLENVDSLDSDNISFKHYAAPKAGTI